jgi:hypothetical protein
MTSKSPRSASATSPRRTGRPALARVTKAKLAFLGAAGASLVVCVALWFTGSREQALFVGLWVPTVLAAGTLVTSGSGRHG